LLFHAPPPPLRPPTEPIHTHALRDGRVALGIALAFGHSGATELQSLVDAAERAGADSIRTAPGRVLLLVGLAPESADSLRAIAERLGFIVHADDPRRRVAACAGAPICASGRIATRALGPAIAKSAAPLLDGALSVHVSGCAKGCADPGAATFTIVGTATGCGVIVNGSARDIPLGTIAPDGLPDGLANLVREVERMR